MWVVSRRSRGDERGSIAIMTAALAALLILIGAMGVDLGNAMNRKKLTQTSADFAALAGAAGLPSTAASTTQLVADALNKNQPVSDGTNDCNPDAGQPVTAAMLTDGSAINGEVTYPNTSNIKVVSPAARVQYGLANIIGVDDGCVQSTAVARIASGAVGMAPYYTTTPCASGQQTLKDNSGGLSLPYTVPPLSHDAETNTAVLTSISPTSIPLAAVGDPDGPSVTLTGTNLDAADIDQVGIFNSDQTEPTIAAITAQASTSITFTVPNAVASYEDVWYVRVHSGAAAPSQPDEWSARLSAQPLQVGAAVLSCDVGPASGNFGSLDIPWGGNDLEDLAKNISQGLRPPTTLVTYPPPLPADNTCQNLTGSGSVISTDTVSRPSTNCLQTVTGLEAKPAYDGYLGSGGKLIVDTSPACTALGRPARHTLTTGESVNDDLLSCFLKNDTLKLSDAIGYTGDDSLFIQDVWKSPRLVIVPLIDHDPNGTKWMPIKSFVVGFICDQPSGASRLSPLPGTQTENGLVTQNPKKLRAMRILFFSMDALPPPPDGTPLQDYLGSGKKVITMVN
jgi:hypothetical protein